MLLTFDSFFTFDPAKICLALRRFGYQLSHPYQVVGCRRESKDPPDPVNSSMTSLAHHPDRLHPAEDFFDALPRALTDRIADMSRRPMIKRPIFRFERDVRRGVQSA